MSPPLELLVVRRTKLKLPQLLFRQRIGCGVIVACEGAQSGGGWEDACAGSWYVTWELNTGVEGCGCGCMRLPRSVGRRDRQSMGTSVNNAAADDTRSPPHGVQHLPRSPRARVERLQISFCKLEPRPSIRTCVLILVRAGAEARDVRCGHFDRRWGG
jgi:hypothetical protein